MPSSPTGSSGQLSPTSRQRFDFKGLASNLLSGGQPARSSSYHVPNIEPPERSGATSPINRARMGGSSERPGYNQMAQIGDRDAYVQRNSPRARDGTGGRSRSPGPRHPLAAASREMLDSNLQSDADHVNSSRGNDDTIFGRYNRFTRESSMGVPGKREQQMKILKNCPQLQDFSDEELGRMADKLKEQTVEEGEQLVMANKPFFRIFVVVNGTLSCHKQGQEGEEFRLNNFDAVGDTVSLETGAMCSVEVRGKVHTKVVSIHTQDFLAIIQKKAFLIRDPAVYSKVHVPKESRWQSQGVFGVVDEAFKRHTDQGPTYEDRIRYRIGETKVSQVNADGTVQLESHHPDAPDFAAPIKKEQNRAPKPFGVGSRKDSILGRLFQGTGSALDIAPEKPSAARSKFLKAMQKLNAKNAASAGEWDPRNM